MKGKRQRSDGVKRKSAQSHKKRNKLARRNDESNLIRRAKKRCDPTPDLELTIPDFLARSNFLFICIYVIVVQKKKTFCFFFDRTDKTMHTHHERLKRGSYNARLPSGPGPG